MGISLPHNTLREVQQFLRLNYTLYDLLNNVCMCLCGKVMQDLLLYSCSECSFVQAFKVSELIGQCKTSTFNGAEVVERLHNGLLYTRNERIHFVKIISKYLMFNCAKWVYVCSSSTMVYVQNMLDWWYTVYLIDEV